jgi:hypothetical protein
VVKILFIHRRCHNQESSLLQEELCNTSLMQTTKAGSLYCWLSLSNFRSWYNVVRNKHSSWTVSVNQKQIQDTSHRSQSFIPWPGISNRDSSFQESSDSYGTEIGRCFALYQQRDLHAVRYAGDVTVGLELQCLQTILKGHYVTRRKVAISIPDKVHRIFKLT